MFNLITLVNAIEKIGKAFPNVNTVVLSDIYKLNAMPDIDFSVFAIVQQEHRQDDDYFYFNFVLYFVDRLLNDKSNQLEIQSHGISLLSTVISKIEDLGLIVNSDIDRTYQSFNQRFSDECAGVFARVEIQVPIDCTIPFDVLVDPVLADLDVYEPGTYYPENYGADAFKTITVEGELPDIWVKKKPEHVISTSGTPADYNELTESGYYYVDVSKHQALNSPFEGFQSSCLVHTIRVVDYSGDPIGNIVQYASTQLVGNTWPRLYYRVRAWSDSGMTWSPWTKVDDTDFVNKNPELHRGYDGGGYNFDFNNYTGTGFYVLEAMSSQNTVNGPGVYGNAILSVIALVKNDTSKKLDDVLQIYYTAADNTGDTDIYLRRRYWNSSEDEHYWGNWIKVFSQTETEVLKNKVMELEERIQALENAD